MKGSLESLIKRSTLLLGGVSVLLFIVVLISCISSGNLVGIIGGIVGILFAGGFTFFLLSTFKNKIFEPVKAITEGSDRIKSGDYGTVINVRSGNDLDEVAGALNEAARLNGFAASVVGDISNGDFTRDVSGLPDTYALTRGLKELYYNMAKAFSDLSGGAEQVNLDGARVSSASQSLSQGVYAQVNTVEQLSSTVNGLRTAVIRNAENARVAQKNADEASEAVTDGTEKMNELLKAMDDISNSTNEIAKFNKVIEDIAFQTNILALNASVEAARAGDAGKGFAVVASEVKNLAIKSQEASHQTSTVIMSCVESVKDGVEKTHETASAFSVIAEKANEIGRGLTVISQECEQQSEAITQINIGVEQISGVIQSTSATADDCARSAAALTGRSGDLREIVGRFRFGDIKVPAGSGTKPGKSAQKQAPKPESESKPASKPAASEKKSPAQRTAAKTEPAAKPVTKAAPKPAAPAPKPVSSAPKPAPRASAPAAPAPASRPGRTAVITQSSGSYANAEFVDVPDNKY